MTSKEVKRRCQIIGDLILGLEKEINSLKTERKQLQKKCRHPKWRTDDPKAAEILESVLTKQTGFKYGVLACPKCK